MTEDVVGFEVITKNTTYVFTREEGGRIMLLVKRPSTKGFSLSSELKARGPLPVTLRYWPPQAGERLIIGKVDESWPFKEDDHIVTTRVQEIWPLTESDILELSE